MSLLTAKWVSRKSFPTPYFNRSPDKASLSEMKSGLSYAVTFCFLIALVGCGKSSVYYPGQKTFDAASPMDQKQNQAYWEKVEQLEQELTALSCATDKIEARQLAETALRESAVLAEEYQLVQPAVAHNLMVFLGIKDRGLCYHWTEDLMKRLQTLELKSFQFHWGVAHRGSELREHNGVVVTAKGQDFFQGIILDPWRNSGRLYWARIAKDSYSWKALPPSDW
jgi:hypothetical protein